MGIPSLPQRTSRQSSIGGDGTPLTPGTVEATPFGFYPVRGSHTYNTGGNFLITVGVQDVGGSQVTMSASAIVSSTSAPEPGSLPMVLAGIGSLCLLARRGDKQVRTFLPKTSLQDLTGEGSWWWCWGGQPFFGASVPSCAQPCSASATGDQQYGLLPPFFGFRSATALDTWSGVAVASSAPEPGRVMLAMLGGLALAMKRCLL